MTTPTPQSETPETNAFIISLTIDDGRVLNERWAIFARSLERRCLALAEWDKDKADLAVLRERLKKAEKDAERYQWLRSNPNFMGWEPDFLPDQVDAAIDATREQEDKT